MWSSKTLFVDRTRAVNEQVRSTTRSYKLDSNLVRLINEMILNTKLGLIIKRAILINSAQLV
jgi:hypothetical protein